MKNKMISAGARLAFACAIAGPASVAAQQGTGPAVGGSPAALASPGPSPQLDAKNTGSTLNPDAPDIPANPKLNPTPIEPKPLEAEAQSTLHGVPPVAPKGLNQSEPDQSAPIQAERNARTRTKNAVDPKLLSKVREAVGVDVAPGSKIKVQRKNGIIVLSGTVPTAADKDAIGTKAVSAAGGQPVLNQLTVK